MPIFWREFGYNVFIWPNENNEPLHFHITEGLYNENCTKFWVDSNGAIILCHNKSRYKVKDLHKFYSKSEDKAFFQMLITEWADRGFELKYVDQI